MRKFLKYFLFLVVFSFHGVMFAVVNYVFPHYDVTRVTGVEVKRVDKDGPITKVNPADGPTRDVYFINTQNDEYPKLERASTDSEKISGTFSITIDADRRFRHQS